MWQRMAGTCAAAVLLSCVAGTARGQAADTLRVSPARAEIGVFHDGVQVTVVGEVAAGTDVAVVVSGPAVDLHLRSQARVWRVFWAPAEPVTFTQIPTLYIVHTSTPLTDLAPDSIRRAYHIGYGSFRPTAERYVAELFPELIRLKESEGLFDEVIGGVQIAPGRDGRDTVTAAVVLPARAQPATYRVALFGFRDGQLVLQREGQIEIARGPFNALVSRLAHEHRLLYGIVAVGVAIGAGLLVGLAFGTVKGH